MHQTNNMSDEKTSAEVEKLKLSKETSNQDILSSNYWKYTKAYKELMDTESQLQYYTRMQASEDVLRIVGVESKRFGSIAEKIICEIFKLGPRTSSQNDGVRNNKKIEIKCARYWGGTDNCKWQHLEPDHDYEYVLFGLLDFHTWKIWGIKKSVLMGEMREKKIVTYQGKQGWWCEKNKIIDYLTPINNNNDLDKVLAAF